MRHIWKKRNVCRVLVGKCEGDRLSRRWKMPDCWLDVSIPKVPRSAT